MIAYTDNQNGTGITAAVTGAQPAETHSIFVQTLNAEMVDWRFLPVGTITGNESLAVSIAGSAHFRYAVSSVSGPTPVEFGIATTAQESTHFRCLEAVAGRLKLLNLPAIANADIHIRKLGASRQTGFESAGRNTIVVSPPGVEGQGDAQGTNARDDITYPVVITLLSATDQDLVGGLGTELKWRQTINKAFRQQHLPGVDCIYRMRITPGPITDQAAFWEGKYHSSFVIQCVSREGRGI